MLKISGRAITGDGILHGLQAEVRRQRVGDPPRQHPATGPVQDRKQIHEAPRHRDVGDIGGPDMIGSRDRQGGATDRGRPDGPDADGWCDGFRYRAVNAHAPHQCRHMPPPDGVALLPQEIPQHAGTGKGMTPDAARRSDASAQAPSLRPASAGSTRWIGPVSAAGIAAATGSGMGMIDHRFALSKPALVSAPSKKSFSRASWPILAWRVLRSGVSAVGLGPAKHIRALAPAIVASIR